MDRRARRAQEEKRRGRSRNARRAAQVRKQRMIALGGLVCLAVVVALMSPLLRSGGEARVDTPTATAVVIMPPSLPAQNPTVIATDPAVPTPDPSAEATPASPPPAAPTPSPSARLEEDVSISPSPGISSPSPSPTPALPVLRSATIRSIGDFVIHNPIFESAFLKWDDRYDFAPMLQMLAPAIGNATLTVANVDGVMRGERKKYAGYPEFDTPPELIEALLASGVDMLTLANNHALDYFFDGLKATIANCEKYGMDYIGGARNQEERDTPAIRDLNGIQVGFLNYTETVNRKELYSNKNATVYGVIMLKDANFRRDIAKLRNAGADVVVVYVHWGTEYVSSPDKNQRQYAQKIADAGADAIIGSHPHVIQPAVWIDAPGNGTANGKTLCLYSLGNFLADKRSEVRDTGMVFEFTIEETADGRYAVRSPKYITTYIWRYKIRSSTYEYRVVNCGEWLDGERPEGMSERDHQRLKNAWQNTRRLMGDVAEAIAG